MYALGLSGDGKRQGAARPRLQQRYKKATGEEDHQRRCVGAGDRVGPGGEEIDREMVRHRRGTGSSPVSGFPAMVRTALVSEHRWPKPRRFRHSSPWRFEVVERGGPDGDELDLLKVQFSKMNPRAGRWRRCSTVEKIRRQRPDHDGCLPGRQTARRRPRRRDRRRQGSLARRRHGETAPRRIGTPQRRDGRAVLGRRQIPTLGGKRYLRPHLSGGGRQGSRGSGQAAQRAVQGLVQVPPSPFLPDQRMRGRQSTSPAA